QRSLPGSRWTVQEVAAMIRYSQARITLLRAAESSDVFDQLLLLASLQNHRFERTRGVVFRVLPTIVVGVQPRTHAHTFLVTAHNVIYEALQEYLLAPNCAKR